MSRSPQDSAGRDRAASLELLRRVRQLESIARRNRRGLTASQYATRVRGQGLLYEESRRYVHGDPARHIDWNVTARLGEPFVKVHRDERRRPVMLAVDLSPSMATGFGGRTKAETAIELAATVAVSVIDGGDRLGHLLFSDRLLAASRPRGGRRHLHAVFASFLDHARRRPQPIAGSDPRIAIHALEEGAAPRAVVYLISDFFDHDVGEDLRYLRARHDVTLCRIHDPAEAILAAGPQRFVGRSPEGPAAPRVVGGGRSSALPDGLPREARRRGLGYLEIATDQSVASQLLPFFHARGRRP